MNMVDLLAKTKNELLKIAQRHGLRGVSTLKKEELADMIHQAQQRVKGTASKEPAGVSAIARKVADAVKRRAVRKQHPTEAVARAEAPVKARARTTTRPVRRAKVAAKSKLVELEAEETQSLVPRAFRP